MQKYSALGVFRPQISTGRSSLNPIWSFPARPYLPPIISGSATGDSSTFTNGRLVYIIMVQSMPVSARLLLLRNSCTFAEQIRFAVNKYIAHDIVLRLFTGNRDFGYNDCMRVRFSGAVDLYTQLITAFRRVLTVNLIRELVDK